MLNDLFLVFNKDKFIKINFYKNKISFYHICKKFIFTFVKILKPKIKKNTIIPILIFGENMDLIKDRIAHIIRAKNLTATQFAELMQIQPSNVSHLLSGRNKPSLDFLIKLKDLFPEYSFDWIILGKKPITVSEHIQTPKEYVHEDNEVPKLFEDSFIVDKNNNEEPNVQENIIIDKSSDNDRVTSKMVKQIIYIYDDNTFEILEKR